jgi:uncharacterized protein YcbK (DUF882 family)
MQYLIRFVRHTLAPLAVSLVVLCPQASADTGEAGGAKSLTFFHTHTEHRLHITFAYGKTYDAGALESISDFLKDFRNGEKIAIDPALLEFLYDLQRTLGSTGTFEVISAYRSPQTNQMLRSRSNGVARRSQHLLGKAIDVRLDDVDLATLRDTAIAMKRGGVGYYPRSNFVHLDAGRVRRW